MECLWHNLFILKNKKNNCLLIHILAGQVNQFKLLLKEYALIMDVAKLSNQVKAIKKCLFLIQWQKKNRAGRSDRNFILFFQGPVVMPDDKVNH